MSKQLFVAAASFALMFYLVSINSRDKPEQQTPNEQSKLSICLSKYDDAEWIAHERDNIRYEILEDGKVQNIYVSEDRLICRDTDNEYDNDECTKIYVGDRTGKCGKIATIENDLLIYSYPYSKGSSKMVRVVIGKRR